MFRFRETVFSGKNAIKKNVEEKTFYLPKAGYMRENGNISTDRFKARILKLDDKEVFEKILNFALQKEKIKSKQ